MSEVSLTDLPHTVVMLGASGAVGQEVLSALLRLPQPALITTLGRRHLPGQPDDRVLQHIVDVHDPSTYQAYLEGQRTAVCTFGVGQPSKMSHAEFVRIDKDAVLAFARACKQGGVKHFQLLGSVGADPGSRIFYLRTKGELRSALIELGFERLSIFQPSMILTPQNRYGLSQAITLALWPKLSPFLTGGWSKYRGIKVSELGNAIAKNIFTQNQGTEILHWPEFTALNHP